MNFIFQKIIIMFYVFYYHVTHFFKNSKQLLINYNGFEDDQQQETEDQQEKKKPIIPFENKYLEEYNKLKSEPLSNDKIESLSNAYLMEFTPVGNIVMCYDKKKEAFVYYCDNVVPFRYLEPVGRKYVIRFQCRELFHGEEDAKKDEKEDSSVVITNKPMKTKDILNGIRNPKQTPQSTKKLIEKKTNRYTSLGRYSNFKMIKSVDKKIVDKNYSISFSDFKKMTTNKTLI